MMLVHLYLCSNVLFVLSLVISLFLPYFITIYFKQLSVLSINLLVTFIYVRVCSIS